MRVDEFQDFLNKDLAWRKMEISQLFGILSTAESKSVVCKSMILLLYAHWEGFIKKSSKCYGGISVFYRLMDILCNVVCFIGICIVIVGALLHNWYTLPCFLIGCLAVGITKDYRIKNL